MGFKFLAVDDEQPALNRLVRAILSVEPKAEIRQFTNSVKALEECKNGFAPDVAFLDISMPEIKGIELAKRLKDLNSNTKIIFVTAYDEYALDAFRVNARGYIMKPADADEIRLAIAKLYEEPLIKKEELAVRIQCFGNFEVFVDEKPVHFTRSKSRELFAYLVDRRGARCSIKEIAAVMFEDREYSTAIREQMKKIRSDMIKSLAAVKADDIILRDYSTLSIDISKVDCDYYKFLKMDSDAVNSYMGEYMSGYSWAEFTNAALYSKT